MRDPIWSFQDLWFHSPRAVVWRCWRDPEFSRFDRTPTCDRQTDIHTDGYRHTFVCVVCAIAERSTAAESSRRPLIVEDSKHLNHWRVNNNFAKIQTTHFTRFRPVNVTYETQWSSVSRSVYYLCRIFGARRPRKHASDHRPLRWRVITMPEEDETKSVNLWITFVCVHTFVFLFKYCLCRNVMHAEWHWKHANTQDRICTTRGPIQLDTAMGSYTVSQKTTHSTFDHNCGKYEPVFKILSLSDSQGNSLCNCYRFFHLTLTMLLYYLVKVKKSRVTAERLLILSKLSRLWKNY